MLNIENQTNKEIQQPKLEYRFDHKRKIQTERLAGNISINDLVAFESGKFNDPEHNDSYAVIIDIRGAVFELNKDEIKMVYNFLEDYTSRLNMNRKFAFIANTPNEVVIAELFLVRFGRLTPAYFKIFSTEAAAEQWITIN
jgi:hypothetical protein